MYPSLSHTTTHLRAPSIAVTGLRRSRLLAPRPPFFLLAYCCRAVSSLVHAAMWARSRGEKVAWVGGAQAYSLEVWLPYTPAWLQCQDVAKISRVFQGFDVCLP